MQGFLDYQHNKFLYSRHSELSSDQNLLNSSARVEAVQDWLFVDARARVQQVNTSPFGSSATETPGANPNRTETSVVQLSPYVRGALADRALYQFRFNGTASHASGNAVPDTTTQEWVGHLRNAPGVTAFGWAADASRLTIRNTAVGEREDSRLRGSLMYALRSDLRVAAYQGVEFSDLAGTTKERVSTPGFGLEWSPSARTQVAGVAERRFFGTGHSLVASHRTPRAALKYTDQKDVSTLPGRLAAGGQSSISSMMSDLLAASVPDPIVRADAVRTQLERTGVAEYPPASTGFLTTGATVSGRRDASLALLGKTNTATLTATRSEFHAIGPSLGLVATESPSLAIRQEGFSASWAHLLSARSSVTLLDSHVQTKDLTSNLGSRQHTLSLTFLTSVGRHTSFSIGARRLRFDGQLATGYVENSAVITAGMRF
jgi:uncharacterized protein (PEP-CTERM system associated)